jgi:hypothetical protein
MGFASRDAGTGDARRKSTADPRIERRSIGIDRPHLPRSRLARRDRALHLLPRAEAGIDQAVRPQARKCFRIIGKMLGLPPRRAVEPQAEPGKILMDRLLELRLAARLVDVLDPQQQPSAERRRDALVCQRRERMAEMQPPVRARREAQDRPVAIGGGRCHASLSMVWRAGRQGTNC